MLGRLEGLGRHSLRRAFLRKDLYMTRLMSSLNNASDHVLSHTWSQSSKLENSQASEWRGISQPTGSAVDVYRIPVEAHDDDVLAMPSRIESIAGLHAGRSERVSWWASLRKG